MHYTKEMTENIVERYSNVDGYENQQKLIKEMAVELKTSEVSVRQKLVAEQVYQSKPKEVQGTSKAAYVNAVSAIIGKQVTSLNKADAKAIFEYLKTASDEMDAKYGV